MNSGDDAVPRVGFIGAGKMATALARGLCRSGFTTPDRIAASDVSAAAREHFAAETGGQVVESNVAVVNQAQIVVVAVKPHQVKQVLTELHHHATPKHLILSIAAGVSLDSMLHVLGHHRRVVRVMPNTPCLVGDSASAFCLGGAATAEDGVLVEKLLSSVGIALSVPENMLDAVTGLSGSGPAYVFVMIEALSDGGVRMGLSRDVAQKLAAQTVLGAARLVLETGQHPGALKDAVASPGGTTIAGLHELERGALRATLMNAVEAATTRSRELGRPS
jgi:pyrroline-5-carboxylate reductase